MAKFETTSWSLPRDNSLDGSLDALDERRDSSAREASARRQRLLEAHRGEWVAVSDDYAQVYAHGPSYLNVCESARAAGAVDPLLTRLL